MDRVYRVARNRASSTFQATPEITEFQGHAVCSAGERPLLRHRPLALACAAVLALGASVNAWSAPSCSINGESHADCVVGEDGPDGAAGTAGASGTDGSHGSDGFDNGTPGAPGAPGGDGAASGLPAADGGAGGTAWEVSGQHEQADGVYLGGAGGSGGAAGPGGDGGDGGNGGDGGSVGPNGAGSGGDGGRGGHGAPGGAAGTGGAGGSGVSLDGGADFSNSGVLAGGAGGVGGRGGYGGAGGQGGAPGHDLGGSLGGSGGAGGNGGNGGLPGSGGVGGAGVTAADSTLTNSGIVAGGVGGVAAYATAEPGRGGAGIRSLGAFTLHNATGGRVVGGMGAAGSSGDGVDGITHLDGQGMAGGDAALGGTGGTGGAGIQVLDGDVLNNATGSFVIGGEGGKGGNANGGAGGQGANGAAGADGVFDYGGDGNGSDGAGGGDGGQGGKGGSAGAGGSGGAAVSGDGFFLHNDGTLIGGAGGAGGDAHGGSGGQAGQGGNGGRGADGTAEHPDGGIGGRSGDDGQPGDGGSSGTAGVGGQGGAGVSGNQYTLVNTGLIVGGAGGTGGAAVSGAEGASVSASGDDGDGGAGVVATGDSTIINTGIIEGGLDAAGNRAEAVLGSGGATTLSNAGHIQGTVRLDAAAANDVTLMAGGSIDGDLDIGTDPGSTLTLDGSAGTDQMFSQAVTGATTFSGMLTKRGSDSWTLDDTALSGVTHTALDEGTLMVGDAAHPQAVLGGSLQVASAGTLRGHGTIGGSVTNHGIVWPGGSIGTLTIAGDYIQASDGTLKIEVTPAEASLLNVGGSASLAGGLDILYGPGTYTERTYEILTAGEVNGAFDQVEGNTPADFRQEVVYQPTAVQLALLQGASDTDPTVVSPTNATLFGAMGSAILRAGQKTSDQLLERMGGVCTSASDIACVNPGERLWAQAQGSTTRIRGNHGAPDVKDDGYGILAGVDRQYGEWMVGVAGGYSHNDVREITGSAAGKIDTVRAAAYGGRALGPVYLSGVGSYAYNFVSTFRDFGAFGEASDDGGAHEFTAGVQVSLPMHWGALSVAPRAGLRYAYVHGLSGAESGLASQALDVHGQTLKSLQPYVGLTLDYAFSAGNTQELSHLQFRAGYAYETQSTNRDVSVASSDGTRFIIPGTRDSRGAVSLGLGLEMPVSRTTRVHARYDAVLFTGNVRVQSAQIGLEHKF